MKSYCKIILITILAISASLSADAQLRYGFRFGGDFAKASITNNGNIPLSLVNRSGFSGGLALEYQFEKCGFAPDIALLYTRYNTRLVLPGAGTPQSFGRNFIEIPIHLKWKLWLPQTNNLFALMAYAGPSMMFRLDHNSGIEYRSPNSTLPQSSPTFKSKAFQPGMDVGIGFDIINFIQVTAGYRFGLGNAFLSPDDVTLHTNGWNVAATLLFDF